jgi:hypothetical protein
MITQELINLFLHDQHRHARTRDNRLQAQYQRSLDRQAIHDLVDELSIDEQE